MKHTGIIILVILVFTFVVGCGKKDKGEAVSGPYTITGTIYQDSVHQDRTLQLFIDQHDTLIVKELAVTNGHFEYQGSTSGVDELFLMTSGSPVDFFAYPGMETQINIDSDYVASYSGNDTINQTLQDLYSGFDTLYENEYMEYMDTVCNKFRNSMVASIFVRNRMQFVNDSLMLRQDIGNLEDAVKPDWLMNAIENQFDAVSSTSVHYTRLNSLINLKTSIDTLDFDLRATRQDGIVMYFWADYNQQSIDSLQLMTRLAKYYGLHEYVYGWKEERRPKRMDIMTVCLHETDSAAWKEEIKDIPGTHVWIKAGIGDPAVISWKVTGIPYNIILDRFSNIQGTNLWGEKLIELMDKMPSNFSVEIRHNGSKNNLSRPPRR